MELINLVNSAKAYASHGFSVIPIDRFSKRPLIKFADKPPLTSEQIDKIWIRHPLANIALKTDKFFVIDIDRHGDEDGTKAIKALNHPEWFSNTLCERTAHDGFHYFFLKPVNGSIQQSIGFLPGVDIKAHVNNYVVVAPSVIDDKPYKWLNSNPIQTVPKPLLDLINEKAKEHKPIQNWDASYTTERPTKTTKLFEMIANGLGDKGQRNDNLTSFVGGLLFRNVEIDTAVELAKIANHNTPDPLPVKEFDRTVTSMIDKETKRREGFNG